MKTELIASWKLVVAKGREMVIVTTVSGATVWVPKAQFDTNAETVSYTLRKAGEAYTNSAGEAATLKADRNDYNGCGRQIVKKYDSVQLFTELHKLGIVPAINMS